MTPTPSMTMTPSMTPTSSQTSLNTSSIETTQTLTNSNDLTDILTSITSTPSSTTIANTTPGLLQINNNTNTTYSPSNNLSYSTNDLNNSIPDFSTNYSNNRSENTTNDTIPDYPNINTPENTISDNTLSNPKKSNIIPSMEPDNIIFLDTASPNSNSIDLTNVDPSLFQIGGFVRFTDGTIFKIKGVIFNGASSSTTTGFSNYLENFQEGMDNANITLILEQSEQSNSVQGTANQTSTTTMSPFPYKNTALTEKNILNMPTPAQRNINTTPSYQKQDESDYIPQEPRPSSNVIVRPNENNVFQSGNMSVNLSDHNFNNTPGQLPSISKNSAHVNFPSMDSTSDMYSYYGALRTKGSDYAPSNTISETNKMLSRLDYVPPPLSPNFDFNYYGALRSKGVDAVKPVNGFQGLKTNNSEQILDEKLYAITGRPGYEEMPVPNRIDYAMIRPEINMNRVSTFSSNPIDLYSQYGALRPKE